MKTLKQHIKDKELDDFEEDLMAEKAPDTADAMKRYKAGKADMNVMAKASEMKVADMKDTLRCYKYLTPEETKHYPALWVWPV